MELLHDEALLDAILSLLCCDFQLQTKVPRYVSTLEDDAESSHDESSAEIHLSFCADFREILSFV